MASPVMVDKNIVSGGALVASSHHTYSYIAIFTLLEAKDGVETTHPLQILSAQLQGYCGPRWLDAEVRYLRGLKDCLALVTIGSASDLATRRSTQPSRECISRHRLHLRRIPLGWPLVVLQR